MYTSTQLQFITTITLIRKQAISATFNITIKLAYICHICTTIDYQINPWDHQNYNDYIEAIQTLAAH